MTLRRRDPDAIDRRTFLKRTAVTVGGASLTAALPFKLVRKAAAEEKAAPSAEVRQVRSVCTHCSVGCGIVAEVRNGVWVGQEPAFDHPFNLGAHCAKGASVREHGHG
ncbi:MAG TPA: twin-arginine translocation signal domain-containing protein, partial [Methylothermaceae bacterium]|nr:twin-arginine translocation signal domain-containing protein [Methylothermaceae bacterium]